MPLRPCTTDPALGEASIVVHGIRTIDLEQAPPLDKAIAPLLEAMAGRVLVAHAAAVERSFLKAALRRQGARLREPIRHRHSRTPADGLARSITSGVLAARGPGTSFATAPAPAAPRPERRPHDGAGVLGRRLPPRRTGTGDRRITRARSTVAWRAPGGSLRGPRVSLTDGTFERRHEPAPRRLRRVGVTEAQRSCEHAR